MAIHDVLHQRNFLLHLQYRPDYGDDVLVKEPAHEQLSGAQIAQLHNEHVITRQLVGVAGVRPVYGLEGSENHPVLLLEFIEGQSLGYFVREKPLALAQNLQLAVEIAGILGRIHDNGVMHRDINGSNIMIAAEESSDETGRVSVIDFGVALTVKQEAFSRPITDDTVVGTAAYISPEQTGRMNRVVDYRSDLYSLGVTLYELFTGQLPFQADDTMGMIHAHMAAEPLPPHARNPELPKTLSDIILKLLAKNAEERYQSALGLGSDLEACLDQWQRSGTIEPFELGQNDFTGRLQFPQKLYGRQAEIAQLSVAYDRVVEGNVELLFIAGYSGVGKTALVHEMRRDVLIKQGIFIEGKFDQLQQINPYSAWAQAFTQLVNKWLAESETNLAGWRETVLDAVGDTGQILIDIISVLERIIGPQPPVPQLGVLESQNRLNYTFNRFISSLATPEHPLVVFLDDLQWIDQGSLNLIESLVAIQSRSSLQIIGTYRNNEVGPDHPLLASQERMSSEEKRVKVITLADLKPSDLDHFLADTLQTTTVRCRELSQVLAEKTAGNPFFFRQQLYALESEDLLTFDRSQRRWTWAADLQQSLQAVGNVVDLMTRKIHNLPVESQRTLGMAACVGSQFGMNTLGTITGQPQTDILAALEPALQGGLIGRSNGDFSFVHDRIQEAGYALIPKSDLPQTHLEIGRLLLADRAVEELEEEIFAIVSHLNRGRALIDNKVEKNDLAALNLIAGQKAKAASAFHDAKQYVEVGLEQLGPNSWPEHYELTLSLHNENGELAALTGQYDQIEATAALIHANAKKILDQIGIYMITIEAETAQYNLPKALEIGLNILRDLEVEIPAKPTPEDYQRLNDRLVELLSERPLESITEMPAMTDERALAISFILASEMSTSYIVDPPLNVIIQYLGAIFTLEFGLNAWSPFFFGVIALLNIGTVNHETPANVASDQIRLANQLVEIVRELLKNPITTRGRTKALQSLTVAAPWLEPIKNGIEAAQATFRSGSESGDLMYGAYGVLHYSMQGFAAGTNLETYQTNLSNYRDLLLSTGQATTVQWVSIYLQAIQNLKEVSSEPDKMNGTYLNQDEWLPSARSASDINGIHIFSTIRLALVYHFDLDDKLEQCMVEVEEHLASVPTVFSTATAYFYLPLARLRFIEGGSQKDHAETMNLVNNGLQLLEIWAQSVPSTFQHQVDLIVAEKARTMGDLDGALLHYEQAIAGAQNSGFTHEEALANELYARFWAERGSDRFASQFIREAHSLYRKWGAMAKAEHLENRYPNWLASRRITAGGSSSGMVTSQLFGNVDLLTVLKNSQAIAAEIELERLVNVLMTSAIENSGAQSGYLLLPEAGRWMIAAHADLGDWKPKFEQPIFVNESDLLSQAVVNYAVRTQETVLLENASQSGEFVDDPHIQSQEVKSLLCTPLVNQGKTSAVLYLENNLSPDVFTPERVELLQLLSSQMAISIENARLLDERSQALYSAEAQIRVMFENSSLGIALSTLEGEILTVNSAMARMLGTTEDELRRQNGIDFYVDPADRHTLLAGVQESGFAQKSGLQLVRNDGSSFFANINMNRLVREGREVLLTLVEDVTALIEAEQRAAVQAERERLARELHDSVTQTIYSAGLLAESTPKLWVKDQALAQSNLDRLSQLLHGASADMRALLYELRAGARQDQTLAMLIEPLLISVRIRTSTSFHLESEGDCRYPDDIISLTFFRIVQECLNNIAKHATATEATVKLVCQPDSVGLNIVDNGCGFDLTDIQPGHLGIDIIRERSENIGASFEIESKIAVGTRVTVQWPAEKGIVDG